MLSAAQLEAEIRDKQEWQVELRLAIDRLPQGAEREAKIDLLMLLHREIDHLYDLLQRD